MMFGRCSRAPPSSEWTEFYIGCAVLDLKIIYPLRVLSHIVNGVYCRMRQETMTIKSSPFLRPMTQFRVVPTHSWKAPPQEPIRGVLGRLNGRISRALDALSQILKAVSYMLNALQTEIKVFAAGSIGVIGPPEGVLCSHIQAVS